MNNGKRNMMVVTVHLPEPWVEALDELVRRGFYVCRSEAIRFAVRDLIRREGHLIPERGWI